MVRGKWSIWLAERPVVANAKKDAVEFGKPFSHPFLILKDVFDITRGEIHGTWGNWPNRGLRDAPGKLLDNFTGAVCTDKSARFLAAVTGPLYPRGLILELRDHFIPRPSIERQRIFKGDKKQALERWEALKGEFPSVNDQALPFYRYATRESGLTNCQIMLRATLEKACTFETIPDLRLAHTGWTASAKPAIQQSL